MKTLRDRGIPIQRRFRMECKAETISN